MRYSKALIPTVKEVPADAEVISHQLMLRAGLMRKVASGTYTYLPAGWRVLLKIMDIVRQEMDRSGAQEILMPAVQPMELWQQTGRDVDYGETLGTFTDRHGRQNVLAPTAEEVVTYLMAGEINSYKQLPINIYQMSFKFRDEFRPRFGVLRSREFIMKDSYSFHTGPESLEETYRLMYDTYCRIFQRCGIEYVIVEAEAGEMGGSGSHQFTIPCENGEDVIVYIAGSDKAWNIEKAPVDATPQPETRPAVGTTEELHTPHVGTIEEVCKFLKRKPKDLIKTLIYSTPDKTVAALVRGDHDINPEKLTQILDGVRAELAEEATVVDITGAAPGFAGPIGILDKVDMLLVDHNVAAMIAGIAGANKTDYHIARVVPGRDFPLEGEKVIVTDIRNAVEGDTYNGDKLLFKRGIEVGQVFKLGNKYSKKLNAKFLDADGTEKACLMGCYGIGINRIMASAIELGNDSNGILWPISIAPWQVIITLAGHDEAITNAGEKLYSELTDKGVEVLLDDRDARPGVKFKDADLLGIPVRITIGKRSIANNEAELKLRTETDPKNIAIETVADEVADLVKSMMAELNQCGK
ncbi:MAG TPA: proline--tRNA ligase [Phycisphaerales bacterium]|nr:proline--tRNA ligase [Phycisphaerales bacterium]